MFFIEISLVMKKRGTRENNQKFNIYHAYLLYTWKIPRKTESLPELAQAVTLNAIFCWEQKKDVREWKKPFKGGY